MTSPPSPHKIHSLPVLVNYNLPSSSTTFTTLFPTLQQVYVHPNSAASRSDGDEDICGSIYLKTVMQGVISSSPELHPSYPSTPDLTLYIFDPRETALRRSRVSTIPLHLRPTHASSPLSDPLSPNVSAQPPQEVWSGKGLVSRALDEPGLGKQLVTGRLIKSTAFAHVTSEMTSLEALMSVDMEREIWGIEVSLSLKSGTGSFQHMPVQSMAPVSAPAKASSPSPTRSTSNINPLPSFARPASQSRPLSPSRRLPPPSKKQVTGKKKPMTNGKPPGRTPRSANSSDAESFPGDIPAQLYKNPETLTKEQAERLMESPAFLSMLSKLTGRPIQSSGSSPKISRKRSRDVTAEGSAKKPKVLAEKPAEAVENRAATVLTSKDDTPTFKCYNCGRTKSAVWRTKVMEDGKSVRVCNACGLYWNKLRVMRPPALWQGVDDDIKSLKKDKSDHPASRIDAGTPGPSGGLKRTLSAAVERDAKRLAQLRSKPKSLLNIPKTIPASSPVRPTGPAKETTGVRNAKWNQSGVAASSPGGWADSMPQPLSEIDNFDPVQASAHTLDMPLSDDGHHGVTSSTVDWNTDLSAFFDLEGFSLPAQGSGAATTPADQFMGSHPGSDVPPESDDVVSQLFNRTSSVGFDSSPATFDFSQLPPSSPPNMTSDLPHSALLLSSPDLSPMDRRTSPAKSTPAKNSVTPNVVPETDFDPSWLGLGDDFDISAFEQLFG